MSQNYGFFAEDKKEYCITTPDTPRHWYNYLWNDTYITFTSQVGYGEGFTQDDTGRRLQLLAGRQIYLLDMESGEYWLANALPVERSYEDYQCSHGNGYTVITLTYKGIRSEFRLFVPAEGNCEIWTVSLTNLREVPCSLKVIPYFRTNLDGPYRPQGYNTDLGYFIEESNAAVCQAFGKYGSADTRKVYGYLTGSLDASGYDTRKNAFIGTYGEESAPLALSKGGCQNSDCNSEKICFALENWVRLAAGAEARFDYAAGIAFSEEEILQAHNELFAEGAVDALFAQAIERLAKQSDGVRIQTPDTGLNHLFNDWLKHESNMGSRWARVRHNGYRDMTSDSECVGTFNPELGWERLKRALTYQYSTGYAPRTWLDGLIRDNSFADNAVWIAMAVYSLVMELGDADRLKEEVVFNDGTSATVYEHAKRAVDFLWNFKGLHGLVKIWGGDWNDLMNQAGLEGKGVSVWLSIAWYRANSQFIELAKLLNQEEDVRLAERNGAEMRDIVNSIGWDGEFYLDAFNDQEEKIGSLSCTEGKVFLIPQLWSVLSGIGEGDKELRAMDAVDRYLETELGTLVSWPAYHDYVANIGEMTQKPAGVHENGGVYLHPSMWKIAVDAMLKRNDKVQMGIEKVLPFNHKWFETKGEPYAMCNSYFTEETGYRYGTPGQSWRTASGAWFVKALVQFVFGLKPQMDGLKLEPCLPPDWKTCEITKEFRGANYHIIYTQSREGGCNSIEQIVVNGEVYNGEVLPYEAGSSYEVRILLG
ncbi:MAG: hypothetical protein K0R57_766 [Paenibacillaceae bacterium]|jgi:cellobiose phosphorylase|nr:hypothetical protein [Paenibacillaceae bacterium]